MRLASGTSVQAFGLVKSAGPKLCIFSLAFYAHFSHFFSSSHGRVVFDFINTLICMPGRMSGLIALSRRPPRLAQLELEVRLNGVFLLL